MKPNQVNTYSEKTIKWSYFCPSQALPLAWAGLDKPEHSRDQASACLGLTLPLDHPLKFHGFVSRLSFRQAFLLVLDGLGTKPFWQRASSWELAKHHKLWWWTPSSSQSHLRHSGGAIWSHQDSLPGFKTMPTATMPKAKPWGRVRSKLKNNVSVSTPNIPWTSLCINCSTYTFAQDFRLAAEL